MTDPDEIIALERRFWQAMKDMDVDAAVALLADRSTSTNARGTHQFSPDEYRSMALSGDARITDFELSDEQVLFPAEDVAIITYRARQSYEANGKVHTMDVFDTTTWVRTGGRWVAAAHTETPAAAGND